MSVSRVISQSRSALARSFTTGRATASILHLVRTAAPQRQFSSSARFQEQVVQTPATGPEVPSTATRGAASGIHAHSIAIMRLPWDTAPADVEQLLRGAGVDVKKLQISIDRFTFKCATSAFVELGGEEQVQKAIKALDSQKINKTTLKVSPLSPDFYWDSGFKKDRRFFYYDGTTPSQAIQGLLEGRRYGLWIEKPGWSTKGEDKSNNATKRELIEKALKPFNVETYGGLVVSWLTDIKVNMTPLTLLDFSTKEDAQRAVKALNGTVIEGRRVELRPHTITAKRAKQIGKVDKGVLAQLQEAGLLPTESDSAST